MPFGILLAPPAPRLLCLRLVGLFLLPFWLLSGFALGGLEQHAFKLETILLAYFGVRLG